MLHIKDLQLTETVLPLFNYTNNPHAEAILLHLLETLPSNTEELYERQNILKALLANWTVLESFSYQRFDFSEVYTFFEGLTSDNIILEDPSFKNYITLLFREEARYKMRSQFVQLVLFLVRIQRIYLTRIDKSKFPFAFRSEFEQSITFLAKLRLEAIETQIRQDQFSTRQILAFSARLNQLTKEEIISFWKFFFQFEAYWSIAKGIRKHNLSFADFTESEFQLEGFYHPSLKAPVRNSIELLPDENVVLLTGPNMSGKSTLLKAIGICVYLAHAGVGVTATNCRIPFYQSIVVAINLSDSLADGYSHFMTEIQNLKVVLQETNKERKCFAIFDEIFRGTNIDDALQITRTTLNGLHKYKNSCFFISTHLLQLENKLQEQTGYIRKVYIDCELQNGQPRFTYSLRDGWSQLKIGKTLFDREGLTEMLSV